MKLYFESFGSTRYHSLLMLHGAGAPPSSLRDLAEGLSDEHQVILPHRDSRRFIDVSGS